jgi:thiamine-monophosphate kinase
MDISDSLFLSLKELSKQSKKKFLITNLNSINPTLYKKLKLKEYHSLILSSGEEFLPVFTGKLSKSNIEKLRSKKINVVNIGIVQKGNGIFFDDLKNIKDNSFDHFKNNYSKL